ncbi:hypothetical protein AB0M54_17315 [Actinoplanes sp. NPDC051470]|uniref:hypothetical protein n=1 Tax=Actinoplanes sp. NPDC051470 TaxID=3157224 RepID=UPI00342A7B08
MAMTLGAILAAAPASAASARVQVEQAAEADGEIGTQSWGYVLDFKSASLPFCKAEGQRGIDRGEWRAYDCERLFPEWWSLYVDYI